MQKLQCWNTEGIFRLIQSIPSPKAEPFKRWLARVGKERIDEIENPELAMGRMQELYESYPKEWIDKRLRGIAPGRIDAKGNVQEASLRKQNGGQISDPVFPNPKTFFGSYDSITRSIT